MTRSASCRVLTSAIMTLVLAQIAACERSEPNQAVQAPVAKAAPAGAPSAAQTETRAAPAGDTASAATDRAPSVDVSGNDTVTVGKSGELSFTIAEAAIEPRNPESMRVVLLVRMRNQQRSAARFADENFRLLTRDSVIGAKGGLDEMVAGQSESKLERVEFVVPLDTVARALRIEYGDETAELPLAFKR